MEQMVQTEQQGRKDHKVTLDHKDQQVQMELTVRTEQRDLKDHKGHKVMSDHKDQQVQMERMVQTELTEQQGRKDHKVCLLYTSPSPRDQRGSRMPSSA